MKCDICKQELVKIYQVGWAHKPYSTCTLDDGLQLVRIQDPNDKGYILYEYVIKDIPIRKFFVEKFNSMEQESQESQKSSNSHKITEIGNSIVVSDNKPVKQAINKKKEFLKVCEPYYETQQRRVE